MSNVPKLLFFTKETCDNQLKNGRRFQPQKFEKLSINNVFSIILFKKYLL